MRVDVAATGRGQIRPVLERREVAAPAAGFVEELRTRENAVVRRGDTLLVLRTGPIRARSGTLAAQIAEHARALRDLRALVAVQDTEAQPGLRSPRYRQEWLALMTEARENALGARQAERDLARVSTLAARGLTPRSEVEAKTLERDRQRSQLRLLLERDRARWQGEMETERATLASLRDERAQLTEQRSRFSVLAAVDGTVEEALSLSRGSFVREGERLFVISPRADLIAEVYVAPSDIGLIRQGAEVRMQVDAFDYTEWGMLAGRVAELPNDFVLVDQQPMFRVKVRLAATELRLRSGVRGRLRKGMTLNARFTLAKRSLWQLLRDDVSDWLDPAHPTTPA
ncbi:MAG TPA: HlyD family efflux transporter periplasmic adaptor subunit [Longimicrobiaceae bacterium]|nr:HlyD family efflux transporter periplasmic adaptor subunit [Longimicrobiaceae bacterium]